MFRAELNLSVEGLACNGRPLQEPVCLVSGTFSVLCLLQDKITASTLALRTTLVAQQAAAKAALARLSVPAGCNRTAEMKYVFQVGRKPNLNTLLAVLSSADSHPDMERRTPVTVCCAIACY